MITNHHFSRVGAVWHSTTPIKAQPRTTTRIVNRIEHLEDQKRTLRKKSPSNACQPKYHRKLCQRVS